MKMSFYNMGNSNAINLSNFALSWVPTHKTTLDKVDLVNHWAYPRTPSKGLSIIKNHGSDRPFRKDVVSTSHLEYPSPRSSGAISE
ncbi:hypothetical protein QYF36_022053 [Acer negundo]|nr:hypothetical protein QYF36_022053 [Acer negundo]